MNNNIKIIMINNKSFKYLTLNINFLIIRIIFILLLFTTFNYAFANNNNKLNLDSITNTKSYNKNIKPLVKINLTEIRKLLQFTLVNMREFPYSLCAKDGIPEKLCGKISPPKLLFSCNGNDCDNKFNELQALKSEAEFCKFSLKDYKVKEKYQYLGYDLEDFEAPNFTNQDLVYFKENGSVINNLYNIYNNTKDLLKYNSQIIKDSYNINQYFKNNIKKFKTNENINKIYNEFKALEKSFNNSILDKNSTQTLILIPNLYNKNKFIFIYDLKNKTSNIDFLNMQNKDLFNWLKAYNFNDINKPYFWNNIPVLKNNFNVISFCYIKPNLINNNLNNE